MNILSLTVPDEVYRQLQDEAARVGKSPQVVAQEWLAEHAARLSAISTGIQVSGELASRLRIEGIPPDKDLVLERYRVQEGAPLAKSDSDRENVRQALRAAGLLTELGPNLRRLADPTVRLEDVSATLGRGGGKTLSEIVLEQRGPRG